MSDSMPVMANTTPRDATKTAASSTGLAKGLNTPLDSTNASSTGDPFSTVLNAQMDTASTPSLQFPTELLKIDPAAAEVAADTGNSLPADAAILGLPLMLPAADSTSSAIDSSGLSTAAINTGAVMKADNMIPVGLQTELATKPLSVISQGLPATENLATTLKQQITQAQQVQDQILPSAGLNQDKQILQMMTEKSQDAPLRDLSGVQANAPLAGHEATSQTAQVHTQQQHGVAALAGIGAGIATKTDMAPAPITVPPQHPGWNNAVSDRVQWMVGNNVHQADIRLDPPDLGSLEVRIQVNKDQATVMFSAPNQQVRDVLESAIPKLREMMSDMGLSLGDVGVSQESFKQRQAEFSQNNANSGLYAEDEIENQAMMDNTLGRRRNVGLVDTYA
ncbi:MAG: flagellar hook-length control protein FliK [Gammaproteobacteria bacterium]|nr:flagellar hook-length control protein FliK [Gammaproteobacteria bacterium]